MEKCKIQTEYIHHENDNQNDNNDNNNTNEDIHHDADPDHNDTKKHIDTSDEKHFFDFLPPSSPFFSLSSYSDHHDDDHHHPSSSPPSPTSSSQSSPFPTSLHFIEDVVTYEKHQRDALRLKAKMSKKKFYTNEKKISSSSSSVSHHGEENNHHNLRKKYSFLSVRRWVKMPLIIRKILRVLGKYSKKLLQLLFYHHLSLSLFTFNDMTIRVHEKENSKDHEDIGENEETHHNDKNKDDGEGEHSTHSQVEDKNKDKDKDKNTAKDKDRHSHKKTASRHSLSKKDKDHQQNNEKHHSGPTHTIHEEDEEVKLKREDDDQTHPHPSEIKFLFSRLSFRSLAIHSERTFPHIHSHPSHHTFTFPSQSPTSSSSPSSSQSSRARHHMPINSNSTISHSFPTASSVPTIIYEIEGEKFHMEESAHSTAQITLSPSPSPSPAFCVNSFRIQLECYFNDVHSLVIKDTMTSSSSHHHESESESDSQPSSSSSSSSSPTNSSPSSSSLSSSSLSSASDPFGALKIKTAIDDMSINPLSVGGQWWGKHFSSDSHKVHSHLQASSPSSPLSTHILLTFHHFLSALTHFPVVSLIGHSSHMFHFPFNTCGHAATLSMAPSVLDVIREMGEREFRGKYLEDGGGRGMKVPIQWDFHVEKIGFNVPLAVPSSSPSSSLSPHLIISLECVESHFHYNRPKHISGLDRSSFHIGDISIHFDENDDQMHGDNHRMGEKKDNNGEVERKKRVCLVTSKKLLPNSAYILQSSSPSIPLPLSSSSSTSSPSPPLFHRVPSTLDISHPMAINIFAQFGNRIEYNESNNNNNNNVHHDVDAAEGRVRDRGKPLESKGDRDHRPSSQEKRTDQNSLDFSLQNISIGVNSHHSPSLMVISHIVNSAHQWVTSPSIAHPPPSTTTRTLSPSSPSFSALFLPSPSLHFHKIRFHSSHLRLWDYTQFLSIGDLSIVAKNHSFSLSSSSFVVNESNQCDIQQGNRPHSRSLSSTRHASTTSSSFNNLKDHNGPHTPFILPDSSSFDELFTLRICNLSYELPREYRQLEMEMVSSEYFRVNWGKEKDNEYHIKEKDNNSHYFPVVKEAEFDLTVWKSLSHSSSSSSHSPSSLSDYITHLSFSPLRVYISPTIFYLITAHIPSSPSSPSLYSLILPFLSSIIDGMKSVDFSLSSNSCRIYFLSSCDNSVATECIHMDCHSISFQTKWSRNKSLSSRGHTAALSSSSHSHSRHHNQMDKSLSSHSPHTLADVISFLSSRYDMNYSIEFLSTHCHYNNNFTYHEWESYTSSLDLEMLSASSTASSPSSSSLSLLSFSSLLFTCRHSPHSSLLCTLIISKDMKGVADIDTYYPIMILISRYRQLFSLGIQGIHNISSSVPITLLSKIPFFSFTLMNHLHNTADRHHHPHPSHYDPAPVIEFRLKSLQLSFHCQYEVQSDVSMTVEGWQMIYYQEQYMERNKEKENDNDEVKEKSDIELNDNDNDRKEKMRYPPLLIPLVTVKGQKKGNGENGQKGKKKGNVMDENGEQEEQREDQDDNDNENENDINNDNDEEDAILLTCDSSSPSSPSSHLLSSSPLNLFDDFADERHAFHASITFKNMRHRNFNDENYDEERGNENGHDEERTHIVFGCFIEFQCHSVECVYSSNGLDTLSHLLIPFNSFLPSLVPYLLCRPFEFFSSLSNIVIAAPLKEIQREIEDGDTQLVVTVNHLEMAYGNKKEERGGGEGIQTVEDDPLSLSSSSSPSTSSLPLSSSPYSLPLTFTVLFDGISACCINENIQEIDNTTGNIRTKCEWIHMDINEKEKKSEQNEYGEEGEEGGREEEEEREDGEEVEEEEEEVHGEGEEEEDIDMERMEEKGFHQHHHIDPSPPENHHERDSPSLHLSAKRTSSPHLLPLPSSSTHSPSISAINSHGSTTSTATVIVDSNDRHDNDMESSVWKPSMLHHDGEEEGDDNVEEEDDNDNGVENDEEYQHDHVSLTMSQSGRISPTLSSLPRRNKPGDIDITSTHQINMSVIRVDSPSQSVRGNSNSVVLVEKEKEKEKEKSTIFSFRGKGKGKEKEKEKEKKKQKDKDKINNKEKEEKDDHEMFSVCALRPSSISIPAPSPSPSPSVTDDHSVIPTNDMEISRNISPSHSQPLPTPHPHADLSTLASLPSSDPDPESQIFFDYRKKKTKTKTLSQYGHSSSRLSSKLSTSESTTGEYGMESPKSQISEESSRSRKTNPMGKYNNSYNLNNTTVSTIPSSLTNSSIINKPYASSLIRSASTFSTTRSIVPSFHQYHPSISINNNSLSVNHSRGNQSIIHMNQSINDTETSNTVNNTNTNTNNMMAPPLPSVTLSAPQHGRNINNIQTNTNNNPNTLTTTHDTHINTAPLPLSTASLPPLLSRLPSLSSLLSHSRPSTSLPPSSLAAQNLQSFLEDRQTSSPQLGKDKLIFSLQEEVRMKNDKIEMLTREVEVMSKKNEKSNEIIASLQHTLSLYPSSPSEMIQKLSTLTTSNTHLSTQYQQLSLDKQSLMGQLRALQAEVSLMDHNWYVERKKDEDILSFERKQTDELIGKLSEMSQRMEESGKVIKRYKRELMMKESEIQLLHGKYTQLEKNTTDQIRQWEKHCDSLQIFHHNINNILESKLLLFREITVMEEKSERYTDDMRMAEYAKMKLMNLYSEYLDMVERVRGMESKMGKVEKIFYLMREFQTPMIGNENIVSAMSSSGDGIEHGNSSGMGIDNNHFNYTGWSEDDDDEEEEMGGDGDHDVHDMNLNHYADSILHANATAHVKELEEQKEEFQLHGNDTLVDDS